MILGVFGPRDFKNGPEVRKGVYYSNYSYIADCLDEYEITKIITGGGLGVEQLALRYAVEKGIDHQVIPPNLSEHGQDAFRIRNAEIITAIQMGVVFWDGRDRFYYELFTEAVDQKTLLHLRHVE
jgi:hypothetical protein